MGRAQGKKRKAGPQERVGRGAERDHFGNRDTCWFLQLASEMGQGASILTFIRLMRILKSRTAIFQ